MSTREQSVPQDFRITIDKFGAGTLAIGLSGDWKLERGLPSIDPLLQAVDSKPRIRGVILEGRIWGS